ncbi:MAG TPA: glycosyltransferase family 2 protein, partial [Lacipirellulaceae bacterium]|nr:glycosyltransferase family 2 protein [Lacipirellulaceae bacterium]
GNWEIVVVEDSSRGATEAIVKQFAAQHPSQRVDYSRNERNSGAAFSRNIGFTKARGEFVALLDADDRWLPDHLAVCVRALEQGTSDLAYSTVLMIEDQTELPLAVWGPDAMDLYHFPYGLFRRNYVTPSATVMRREVLADVGPWGLGFRYCEDADYWFRCIGAGKKFQHVGGCHCLYRKNHDGATTQQLCGTLDEFAQIAEKYSRQTPGLKPHHCGEQAAFACINAANYHVKTNPNDDPSARRERGPILAFKAWRLRPQHVDYLWRAIRFTARNFLRSAKESLRRRPAGVTNPHVQQTPAKAAA